MSWCSPCPRHPGFIVGTLAADAAAVMMIATGALKLVGEAFPWTRDSCFAYTRDNHNSVLGIREQVRFEQQ